MSEKFREGPIEGVQFKPLKEHADHRGWLIELFRADEIDPELQPRMAYVSETRPGVARGPHEHREQTDCFAFVGPGEFKLYLWDAREGSPTRGNRIVKTVGAMNRMAVVIPPGVVHAYKNTSNIAAWVINYPNRLYAGEGRSEPVDEIRHEDDPGAPFHLD